VLLSKIPKFTRTSYRLNVITRAAEQHLQCRESNGHVTDDVT